MTTLSRSLWSKAKALTRLVRIYYYEGIIMKKLWRIMLGFCFIHIFSCSAFAATFSDISCRDAGDIYYEVFYSNRGVERFALMCQRAGVKKPVSSMTEADATAYFKRLKQCADQGKMHMNPKLITYDTKPFLAHISSAKETAKRESVVSSAVLEENKKIEAKLKSLSTELEKAQVNGDRARFDAVYGEINEYTRTVINAFCANTKTKAEKDKCRALIDYAHKTQNDAMARQKQGYIDQSKAQMSELENMFQEGIVSEKELRAKSFRLGEKLLVSTFAGVEDLRKRHSNLSNAIKERANLKLFNAITKLTGTFKSEGMSLARLPETDQELSDISTAFWDNADIINDENRALIKQLEQEYKIVRKNICERASGDLCDKLLANFDPQYKNHVLLFTEGKNPTGITVHELSCAAANKGLFKKFSAGGFFSKSITLELEPCTIKFSAYRMDLETMQKVSDSFKGERVINILEAIEITPLGGAATQVQHSGREMRKLFEQFGGMPQAPECMQKPKYTDRQRKRGEQAYS